VPRALAIISALLLALLVAGGASADTPAPAPSGPGGLWSLYPLGTPPPSQTTAPRAAPRAAPKTPAASVSRAAAAPSPAPGAASDRGSGTSGTDWWKLAAAVLAVVALVATAVPRATR
jgi:hypothetical protein